jgi:hypothetical protein
MYPPPRELSPAPGTDSDPLAGTATATSSVTTLSAAMNLLSKKRAPKNRLLAVGFINPPYSFNSSNTLPYPNELFSYDTADNPVCKEENRKNLQKTKI